jgi:ABC-type multidrug transport system fused ATPase/permease subunit
MPKPTDSTPDYSFLEFAVDIWKRISPYKGKFLLASFFRLSSDVANLYPAWALSQVVTLLSSKTDLAHSTPTLMYLVLGWLCVVLYFGVTHSLAKWFGYQVAERAALNERLEALRHIFTLDIAWQEKENTGNKLKRIGHGSDALNKIIRIFFDVIIEATLNSLGMFIIFSTLGMELGASLLLFMICYFLLSSHLTKRASQQSYLVNAIEEEMEGLSFESLNNIKTIKSLSIQQTMTASLQAIVEKAYLAIRKRITLFRFRSGALNLFYSVFEVGMIAYIVFQITRGNFAPAVLILFVGYFGKVEEAVSELAEVTHEIVINKVQYYRLKMILQTKPTIESEAISASQQAMPQNWRKIEFRDVSFSYGDKAVLQHFNLTIQRGQKIGIVGLSGAGKSTLFNLLLDLYENYQGQILVDDVPLSTIKRQDYINHLSVVLQDTELFNSSLKENIVIGGQPGHKADDKKVEDALTTAHLREVIARLPQGADTVIGEKGVKLSGGEKQRLGIARALYRQPDLLLMDEATSHLDIESEKLIQASLKTFFANVTAVVIAHRLSTIREMDEIVVMQSGKIVEQGTFAELQSKKGVFARLWEKQKL